MNCELVEERLSAYLDNMLAPAERRDVTIHLQACPRCMALLAELRQYDILLTQLPRISPSSALRARLFSLPEVQDLSSASGFAVPPASGEHTRPLTPFVHQTADQDYPQLVSLPGGRTPQTQVARRGLSVSPLPPAMPLQPSSLSPSHSAQTQQYQPARARKRWFTPLKVALVAVLILTLGIVGVLSLNLHRQPGNANLSGAITPPAGPLTGQAIPLAAGSRFVFLRNGTLWSTLVDGSKRQPERLTPVSVTVASGWMVDPIRGNHDAGDLLAYIDLRSAQVHTIRSDGQQDTPIQLTLLQANNTANWQSAAGQTILHSLAWSPDSSKLAFVADPSRSGQTGLYLATLSTGSAHAIATDLKGSFAHPVWSPDGTRLAFTLTHDGVVSVEDYNIKSQSTLDLSNLAAAQGNSSASVLTLNWFSNAGQLAVTWCLGSIGHISSVWIHQVSANNTFYPQQLLSGNYLQALYSPGSNNETGGWLLVASVAGQAGDIWRLNLTTGGQPLPLSQGKQVNFARWSPDGSSVFYLDGVVNGIGKGHLINVITGADQLLPAQVAASPVPDWSADGLQLAYSTGTQIGIVHTLNGGQPTYLHLSGQILNLSWSSAAIHQLVVSLGGPDAGLYLVDTQQNTALQLASLGSNAEIQWTEIP